MNNDLTVSGDLELVEQAEFNGIVMDFYVDENGEMFMTRKQVADALEYSGSQGVKRIQMRNKERFKDLSRVVQIVHPQGGTQNTVAFNRRGVEEICRKSSKPKADEFMDFVFEIYNQYQDEGKVDKIERQIETIAKDEKEEKFMRKINLLKQQIELEDDEYGIRVLNMQIDTVKQKLKDHRQDREIEKLDNRINNLEGQYIPDSYCKAYEIARQLNVTSANNRPHSQLIGAIAKTLGYKVNKTPHYEDEYIKRVYGNNGNGQETYYSPEAVKEIKTYFQRHKYELEYKYFYKTDAKYGLKGDLREKGYKIHGSKFVTYSKYAN